MTTQPTTYTGCYDEREQEKMRRELMLSGFDKISKILIQCPHPTVRSSYINYLKPLMNPCADLSIPMDPVETSLPALPLRRNMEESDTDSLYEELSVYANDNTDPDSIVSGERQWSYEDEPYYDDIFQDEEYIEDHFNSENESDISAGEFYDHDSMYEKPVTTTRVINLFDQQS